MNSLDLACAILSSSAFKSGATEVEHEREPATLILAHALRYFQ